MTILAAVIAASPPPQPVLPEDMVESTAVWLKTLIETWHEETPIKLHAAENSDGGAPDFHHDFLSFIERDCKKPGCFNLHCTHGQDREDPRKRTHKALRKLRRVAPREFDALYLIVAHQHTVRDVALQMTDRAIRLNKPERYTEAGVLVLIASGIDKVQQWW